jgi:hypothetical protein
MPGSGIVRFWIAGDYEYLWKPIKNGPPGRMPWACSGG